MRRSIVVGGLLSLACAAAACSGTAPTANQATNQAPAAVANVSAEAMGARIAALPEPQRLATFYRAIHDAGMDCQDVTAAVPGGTYRGMPVWNARCRGGGRWTLVIGSRNPPIPPAIPTMPETVPIFSGKSSPIYLKVEAMPQAKHTPSTNSNAANAQAGSPIWTASGPRTVSMIRSVCG